MGELTSRAQAPSTPAVRWTLMRIASTSSRTCRTVPSGLTKRAPWEIASSWTARWITSARPHRRLAWRSPPRPGIAISPFAGRVLVFGVGGRGLGEDSGARRDGVRFSFGCRLPGRGNRRDRFLDRAFQAPSQPDPVALTTLPRRTVGPNRPPQPSESRAAGQERSNSVTQAPHGLPQRSVPTSKNPRNSVPQSS